ncbi:hypothetical protein FG05_35329 [Fusarium graminearum]|nr:hypothetical protein FG05_35329 [Fusarium graminearum]
MPCPSHPWPLYPSSLIRKRDARWGRSIGYSRAWWESLSN